MSYLSRKKPKKHFIKNYVGEKFFGIFLGFSRGLLIMMRRLTYRLSNSVLWEPQKFSIILKKARHCNLITILQLNLQLSTVLSEVFMLSILNPVVHMTYLFRLIRLHLLFLTRSWFCQNLRGWSSFYVIMTKESTLIPIPRSPKML